MAGGFYLGGKWRMNCVFSSDDNFADILGCALISLFENNREQETIEVYILDGGISEAE